MRITGTVVWFNDHKGYGFVKSDEGNDSFVHYHNIKEKGFKTLYRGQRITYQESIDQKGLSAINVKYEKNFANLM